MENQAIAYTRVSTEEQAREGVSLDAQAKRIRAYADLQQLHIVDLIREEGVSATKPLAGRPGGKHLLELVKGRKVQHVIALKLDRLFRSALDGLQHATAWDKRGLALHLVDQGGASINTASAIGRFFFTMLAAAAEMERNLICERTTDALAYKKSQREIYGPVPLGFDRNGSHLEENAAELEVIARIQTWRDAGWSLRRIARELNTLRVATKRGRKWHASTISYVLKNSLYREVGS